MHNSDVPRIVAIVGATATGKSDLATRIAQRFDGEIVNADSRLVYRGMDIGTAKPEAQERDTISHHLIDIIDSDQPYSISEYLESARVIVHDIHRRGRLPIVAGGSGQYIWGLIEGWKLPRIPPNPALRAELENLLITAGIQQLQKRLYALDHDAQTKIDIQNPRRVIRAIELASATGDARGGAAKAKKSPFNTLIIGLRARRETIHHRIEKRLEGMIARGWLKEVHKMIDSGIKSDAPSMYAIGYRQVARHLKGEIKLPQMKREILSATHKLVLSQNNWFKPTDKRIQWIDIDLPDADPFQEATRKITRWLNPSL